MNRKYGPRDVKWLDGKLYIPDGLFAYLAIDVSTVADEEAVYLRGRAMMPIGEFNRARRVEDGRRA